MRQNRWFVNDANRLLLVTMIIRAYLSIISKYASDKLKEAEIPLQKNLCQNLRQIISRFFNAERSKIFDNFLVPYAIFLIFFIG